MKLLLLASAVAITAGPPAAQPPAAQPPAAQPPAAQPPAAQPPAAQPAPGRLDIKPAASPTGVRLAPNGNVMPVVGDEERPGCRSYRRQVADWNKDRAGRLADTRTLDREPAGHAFLAVDRRVGGCPALTFLHGRPPAPDAEKPRK